MKPKGASMRELDLHGRWIVVTGAGSGIGRAIAMHGARSGANLAICDIEPGRLAQTESDLRALGAQVVASEVDVAKAASVQRFADAVHEQVDAIDIVVNSAGVALAASALETTRADWEWIVGINLMGAVHVCAAFCPAMITRGTGGHVVNIASLDGFVAMEGMAAYSTTKFAVIGYSEALRAELARSGIGVSAICPGPVRTAIVDDMPERGRFAGSYADRIRSENSRTAISPDRVALVTFRAITKNTAVRPITALAWMIYYMKRLAPGATARAMNRTEQRFLSGERR